MTPFDRFSFSLRFSPGAELSGAPGVGSGLPGAWANTEPATRVTPATNRQSREPIFIMHPLNWLMCGPFPGAGIAMRAAKAGRPDPSQWWRLSRHSTVRLMVRAPGFRSERPMPLSLNDDEYNAVQAAAAPIHPRQRGAFLQALAKEVEGHSVIGPGSCTVAPRPCRRPLSSRRTARRRTPPSRDTSGRANKRAGNWPKPRIGTLRARPRFIASRASWLFRIGQRWGHNPLPTKASTGAAGMPLEASSVPATLCSKRRGSEKRA